MAIVLLTRFVTATLLPQDIASAGGFQGQDIMGGAAIIFKRPQRIRDLVGNPSLVVVKKSSKSVEVARNTSSDRRRPNAPPSRQGQTDVTGAALTASDRAEAFKNQGNTYYDLGQFAQAVGAYENALKYAPQDSVIYNNLGAAYFSLNKNKEAADAFKKSLSIKSDDPDAYFNLGIAYNSTDRGEEALDAFKQAVRLKPGWAEAQSAAEVGRVAKSQANDLAASVLEQTVHLVTRVYLSTPIVAMPAPHIGRRAA